MKVMWHQRSTFKRSLTNFILWTCCTHHLPDQLPHPLADPPPLCQRLEPPLQRTTTQYDLEVIHHWNNMPQATWWLWAHPSLFVPSLLRCTCAKGKKTRDSTAESFKTQNAWWLIDQTLQVPVVFWDVRTLQWLTGPPCFWEKADSMYQQGPGMCAMKNWSVLDRRWKRRGRKEHERRQTSN